MPARIPDGELLRWLEEDAPSGDRTSEALGIGAVPGHAVLCAGAPMVAACVEDAARLLELAGCRASVHLRSGAQAAENAKLITADGPAGDLHRALPAVVALLEHASGIATVAAGIVAAARRGGERATVAATRRHAPGLRMLAMAAAEAGGIMPFRAGVSDGIVVAPGHVAFFGSDSALASALARLRRAAPTARAVVVACGVEQAMALAESGVGSVQLDRAPPDVVAQVAAALDRLRYRPLLVVAGGIHAGNAAAYAASGADVLLTSAQFQAPPRPIKLRIARAR
ncbi:MAG TPA: ModD protein [Acetobacteraceae bacterium]|nr:ModD protein [Acetobacteraceae bacterium]